MCVQGRGAEMPGMYVDGGRALTRLVPDFYVASLHRFRAYILIGGARSRPQEKERKSKALTLENMLIVVSTPLVVPPLALGHAGAGTSTDSSGALRRIIDLLAPLSFGLAQVEADAKV
jgi:hypothetical protein